jgi:hypothetical protein
VSELVDIGATDRNQGTKVKLKTVDMAVRENLEKRKKARVGYAGLRRKV